MSPRFRDHIIVAIRLKSLALWIVACGLLILGVAPTSWAAGSLADVMTDLQWGESAAALQRHFGTRAIRLTPPLEFGDAVAPVALRQVALGGYAFTVFFQLDKKSHGLTRVMYERRPRAATPKVLDAVAAAIATELGQPQSCADPPRPGNGYQGKRVYFWRGRGERVRAIFRDTTIEGGSGCAQIEFYPCGLEARLIILIDPDDASGPDCG